MREEVATISPERFANVKEASVLPFLKSGTIAFLRGIENDFYDYSPAEWLSIFDEDKFPDGIINTPPDLVTVKSQRVAPVGIIPSKDSTSSGAYLYPLSLPSKYAFQFDEVNTNGGLTPMYYEAENVCKLHMGLEAPKDMILLEDLLDLNRVVRQTKGIPPLLLAYVPKDLSSLLEKLGFKEINAVFDSEYKYNMSGSGIALYAYQPSVAGEPDILEEKLAQYYRILKDRINRISDGE